MQICSECHIALMVRSFVRSLAWPLAHVRWASPFCAPSGQSDEDSSAFLMSAKCVFACTSRSSMRKKCTYTHSMSAPSSS